LFFPARFCPAGQFGKPAHIAHIAKALPANATTKALPQESAESILQFYFCATQPIHVNNHLITV